MCKVEETPQNNTSGTERQEQLYWFLHQLSALPHWKFRPQGTYHEGGLAGSRLPVHEHHVPRVLEGLQRAAQQLPPPDESRLLRLQKRLLQVALHRHFIAQRLLGKEKFHSASGETLRGVS